MIIADLHIHTKYSKDSLLEPKTIINVAKRRRLNVIAITDHNTIKGASVTKKLLKNNEKLIIIPGIEMKILDHDILCLFITEQPKKIDNYVEFLEHVKELNAITILAHPFRKRKRIPLNLVENVDLIEIFNARTSKKANLEAKKLAHKYSKLGTAGSDAHLSFEIGRAKTIIPKELGDLEEIRKSFLQDRRIIMGRESPIIVHIPTIAIEYFKKITKYGKIKNINT